MKEKVINNMKKELLRNINEAIKLLRVGDAKWYADWYQKKTDRLNKLDILSKEFRKELKELDKTLVGMGSFDDLPLYPKERSGISEEEARKKQRDLVVNLGEIIDKLLKEISVPRI